MMPNRKPYPEYKDSGISWMKEIPVHWKLMKTKYLFSERVEKGFPNEPLLAATQTKGVVPKEQYENRTVVAQKDLHLLKLVHVGDYVISLRSFQGGIEYTHYRGIISPAYTILKPTQLARREYFEFLFKSFGFVDSLSLYVTGIREGQNIDYERLSRSLLPVPPVEEQKLIGQFLHNIVSKINRYLRAKRRQIELLNEQKQAIIQQAVTRGLNPNVRLKPSGVEWLGDVPEHWEVKRIKYLLREVDHRSITGDETLLSLRMNHGIVPHDEHFQRPGQAPTLVGYKLVKPGQVVLNRLQANNGLVFASEIAGAVSPDYAVFDPITDVNLQFLTMLFRTPMMRCKFRVESKGLGTGTSGFLRIYTDRFGTIQVQLPSVNEQFEIMHGLNNLLSKLQAMAIRIQNEIDLLREYRIRLISDVVTGKLDVHNVDLSSLSDADLLEPLEELEDVPDGESDEESELATFEEAADADD